MAIGFQGIILALTFLLDAGFFTVLRFAAGLAVIGFFGGKPDGVLGTGTG